MKGRVLMFFKKELPRCPICGEEISTRVGRTTISAHSYGWLVLDLDPAETTGDDVIVS